MPGNADGSGFVSLQQYLDANQPAVTATSNGLANDALAAGLAATNEGDGVYRNALAGYTRDGASYDPTNAANDPGFAKAQTDLQAAADKERALKTDGGIQDALTQKYSGKDPGYSTGDARFDAALMGGVKSTPQFGGLDDYLSNELARGQRDGTAAHDYVPPEAPGNNPQLDPRPETPGNAKNDKNGKNDDGGFGSPSPRYGNG